MKFQSICLVAASLGTLWVLAGCNAMDPPAASPTGTAPKSDFKPDVDAGVPVAVTADPNLVKSLVALKSFSYRDDPFRLLPIEVQFERSQATERFVQENNWSVQFEPPVERDPSLEEQDEPQPYRRLAGVIVGDTVLAILIMEDGRAEIVRPGMLIPNTEWRVVSIDEEKAVLRRAGNKRPHTITVPLEPDAGGFGRGGNQGGQGNTGGGGNQQGGNQNRRRGGGDI